MHTNNKSIGDSLLAYLQTHCKKEHVHTREQAINLLQAFFSKYSVSVGKEEIDFTETQRKSYESDYYIARYIVDARESKDEEYTLILSLVKGYLKAAIYMQPENGNLCTESYKDVTFYYDTPVLCVSLDTRAMMKILLQNNFTSNFNFKRQTLVSSHRQNRKYILFYLPTSMPSKMSR